MGGDAAEGGVAGAAAGGGKGRGGGAAASSGGGRGGGAGGAVMAARRGALAEEAATAARAAASARLGALAGAQARWAAELAGAAPRGGGCGYPYTAGPERGRERGGAWKKNELDLLRRSLLSLGLGRPAVILEAMRAQLRGLQHKEADVRDAECAFLRAMVPHADAKDEPFLQLKLHEARAEGELTGCPVQEAPAGIPTEGLPAAWQRVPAQASSWTKRLRILDHVADAIFLCTHEETRSQAKAAIASIPDMPRPASWWGFEQDVALLRGIAQCGYGNYEAVRAFPGFAAFFAKATGSARPREHKALTKGKAHGKGCRCIVCRQSRECLRGYTAGAEGEAELGEVEGGAQEWVKPLEGSPARIRAGDARGVADEVREEQGGGGGEVKKADLEEEPQGDHAGEAMEEEIDTLWPLSDVLTRRVKRIADNLAKLKRRINAREMYRLRETHRAQDWTKRERVGLLKVLMQWGLPRETTSPDSQPNWDVLRELSGLERKSNESMLKGYQGLMLEADRVIADEAQRIAALPKKTHPPDCQCIVCLHRKKKPGENGKDIEGLNGASGDGPGQDGGEKAENENDIYNDAEDDAEAEEMANADADAAPGASPVEKNPRDSKKGGRVVGGVLSPKMARHLKERILIFDSLQQAFASPWKWEISYGLADLPSWWVSGEHDKKLAEGLLLYGVHDFLQALKEDPKFGYKFLPEFKDAAAGNSGPGRDTEMLDVEEPAEGTRPRGGAYSEDAGPAQQDFPPLKVCLKRLKQLGAGYRKFRSSKRAKLRMQREARAEAKRQKLEADMDEETADTDVGQAAVCDAALTGDQGCPGELEQSDQ